jgi:hypothetical protein
LQQNLSQHGAWYLIIVGSVAVVIAIWLPRGLWGTATRRLRFEFFPVGYFVVPEKPAKKRGVPVKADLKDPAAVTDG